LGGMKFLVIERAVVPRLPSDPKERERVITEHYYYLKKLSDEGKILHHSFIGTPGGVNIVDVESHVELDKLMMSFPRFPYCNYEVYPLLTIDEAIDCLHSIYPKKE